MIDTNTSDSRVHPDFYYGLVLLAVGAGLLLSTFDERYEFNALLGDVSTVFFPRLILVLWCGLALALMVNGLRGLGAEEDRARLRAIDPRRLGLVFAVIVASALGLWLFGLLAGGAALVIGIGFILGYRRWGVLVPVGLCLPVVVWFTLGHLAHISLPAGLVWG